MFIIFIKIGMLKHQWNIISTFYLLYKKNLKMCKINLKIRIWALKINNKTIFFSSFCIYLNLWTCSSISYINLQTIAFFYIYLLQILNWNTLFPNTLLLLLWKRHFASAIVKLFAKFLYVIQNFLKYFKKLVNSNINTFFEIFLLLFALPLLTENCMKLSPDVWKNQAVMFQ